MITKTYDETLATLREVVAEAGEDFVYQQQYGEACYYSVNGEPACIVGRVLAKWGVDLTRMDSSAVVDDGNLSGLFANGLLIRLRTEGVLDVGQDGVKLLKLAQARQDGECTWGESLSRAQNDVEYGAY